MPRYAIADIHGCLKTFKIALTSINYTQEDELFLLGDYIDRGPDSLGVLKHIWKLENENHRVICLRGNHEQMLIDYLIGQRSLYEWQPPAKEREMVMKWLRELKFYHETPGYILAHAGLNFRAPDPLIDRSAMLWIRHFYDEARLGWLGGRVLVHGHTPASLVDIKRSIAQMGDTGYACIDSGCSHGAAGMGYLTVLDLDSREGRFIRRVD